MICKSIWMLFRKLCLMVSSGDGFISRWPSSLNFNEESSLRMTNHSMFDEIGENCLQRFEWENWNFEFRALLVTSSHRISIRLMNKPLLIAWCLLSLDQLGDQLFGPKIRQPIELATANFRRILLFRIVSIWKISEDRSHNSLWSSKLPIAPKTSQITYWIGLTFWLTAPEIERLPDWSHSLGVTIEPVFTANTSLHFHNEITYRNLGFPLDLSTSPYRHRFIGTQRFCHRS